MGTFTPANSFAFLLLDAAVKGTVLLLLAWLVVLYCRRSSAAARHAIWCTALAGLLVLPIATWALPAWRIPILPPPNVVDADVEIRVDEDAPTMAAPAPVEFPPTAVARVPRPEPLPLADSSPTADGSSSEVVKVDPTSEPSRMEPSAKVAAAEASDGSMERPDLAGATVAEARITSSPVHAMVRLVVVVWSVGAVLLGFVLIDGLWRTVAMFRSSTPLIDGEWSVLLAELRGRLGLSRSVELREHGESVVPLTSGLLRPIVLLPRVARTWDPSLRRAVLLHELAHVQRGDVACQLLGRLACVLYCFHPLAWYALHRLRQEREQACDDAVVHAGERASDYATQLLAVAQRCRGRRGPAFGVAMAEGSSLERRVVSLFDDTRSHAPLSRRFVVLCLLMGMAIPAGLAPLVPSTAAAQSKEDAPTDVAESPGSEPLPSRAFVRLGTSAYRNGTTIRSFGVSADGTRAVAAGGSGSYSSELAGRFSPARLFDLTDGRCLHTIPCESGPYTETVGISPDGTIVAVKDTDHLRFLDATTGRELRRLTYTSSRGGGRSITDWMTFTPDGEHVAITLMGHDVQLVDVETAKVVRTFGLRAASSACVFSSDGKWMASGGYDRVDKVYQARLFDVTSGEEIRTIPAGTFATANGVKRALAFSPDDRLLAGGGWGDRRLRLWETATGKERTKFPEVGEEFRSVAYAPDGRTIAAAAERVYFYDPETGRERFHIDRRATGLAYTRDGKVLIGAVDGAIHRWDAATGRPLTPTEAQDGAVEQILFGADDRTMFTTDLAGNLLRWDGATPRRVGEGAVRGVVASPDRRRLAWIDGYEPRIYDTVEDRLVENGIKIVVNAPPSVVALHDDGGTLVTIGGYPPTKFQFWDIESGRELRSVSVDSEAEPRLRGAGGEPSRTGAAQLFDVTTGRPIRNLEKPEPFEVADEAGFGTVDLGGLVHVAMNTQRRTVISPDGTTMAIGPDWGAVFMNRLMKSIDGRAFSPDGRLYVDWAKNPWGPSRMDHVDVWETATGRHVTSLATETGRGAANAAFSPDGRTLAIGTIDGVVQLWEVATWRVRTEFRGHRDRITAVTFDPSGRLFTGGLDTTVLGWDVRPEASSADASLDEAWVALAKSDARLAYEAQGRFLAEPDEAVEWFATRVTPVEEPDVERVRFLLGNLDADEFKTRERATAELAEFGPLVAESLRAFVDGNPSDEAGRRARGLLRRIEEGVVPPDELRRLRAVEVLEWFGSPEADARLQAISTGVAEARVTRAAAAAVQRRSTKVARGEDDVDEESDERDPAAAAPAEDPLDDPNAKADPMPAIPLEKVVWWGRAVDGLEPGFWLTSTDDPFNERVPMDSLVKYRVLVRNTTKAEIEFLVRLLPFAGRDVPLLVPSGEINVEGILTDPLAKPYRATRAANPISGVDPAYLVTLAAGESMIVPGELELYVGKDEKRLPRFEEVDPGTHWIVQPLLLRRITGKRARTSLDRLLGELKLDIVNAEGRTRREPATRVAAPVASEATLAHAKWHLEVGTFDAAAHRHVKTALWGKAEKGIECGLRVIDPKQTYAVGDTIEAEVLWRNTGDAVVTTARPRQLDLYPSIKDTDGNWKPIDFGARFNLLPFQYDFRPGEIRSLGFVRIELVAPGTPGPRDNSEPGHVQLAPGKFALTAQGGVGHTNPPSAAFEFTVSDR